MLYLSGFLTVVLQSVRRVHQFRAEGGHNPTSVSAVWADQVDQHVVGPGDSEAQGVCVRGVRPARGGSALSGADERSHAGRQEHQGAFSTLHLIVSTFDTPGSLNSS